jgi:hypothetical protein
MTGYRITYGRAGTIRGITTVAVAELPVSIAGPNFGRASTPIETASSAR